MKRLKEREAENARLKKTYADEKVKAEMVGEALADAGQIGQRSLPAMESAAGR